MAAPHLALSCWLCVEAAGVSTFDPDWITERKINYISMRMSTSLLRVSSY